MFPKIVLTVILSRFNVVRLPAARTWAAVRLPETTWYVSVYDKFVPPRFRPGTGSWVNASFEGANTVKGPAPLRVAVRPAVLINETRVVNPAAVAVSIMDC